jgi:hypothetical protein
MTGVPAGENRIKLPKSASAEKLAQASNGKVKMANRTRLLFHHPPPAPTAGTIEVVVKGTVVRAARTKEMLAVPLRKERKGGEKAQWVGAPARKIQKLPPWNPPPGGAA